VKPAGAGRNPEVFANVAMKWNNKLLWPDPEEPTAPYFLMCSGCREPCPSHQAHVIPHWSMVREDFLTTYRCGKCWKPALAETRIKIGALDAEVREKFCKFLERHRFTDVDIVREASLADASRMLGALLNAIESEKLELSP
jgi:hypothetical protein